MVDIKKGSMDAGVVLFPTYSACLVPYTHTLSFPLASMLRPDACPDSALGGPETFAFPTVFIRSGVRGIGLVMTEGLPLAPDLLVAVGVAGATSETGGPGTTVLGREGGGLFREARFLLFPAFPFPVFTVVISFFPSFTARELR